MLVSRWDPATRTWGDARRLRQDMNRLFSTIGQQLPRLAPGYPQLNVWQDGDSLYAEAELPGMDLQDLEIYVTGGDQLTIKGDRKLPEHGEGVWLRRERPFESFERTLMLPIDVDADKVQARLTHGVLTLTLPKSESAKPKKIKVEAA